MENNDIRENGNGEDFDYYTDENTQKTKSDNAHGWQTVSYAKKQRKQAQKNSEQDKILANGDSKSVFHAVEQHAEERRKKIESLLRSGYAVDTSGTGGESSKAIHSDDDDSDEENNNKASAGVEEEKKKKPKQPKKPKVTVPIAASQIQSSHLKEHLIEITGSYEGNHDIQILRLLDYFGRAFSLVPYSQFPVAKVLKESTVAKLEEIPLSYIGEDVIKEASEWISLQPVEALKNFSVWAFSDLLNDFIPQQMAGKKSKQSQANPKQKVGVLVQLAIILRTKPEVLLQLSSEIRSNKQYHSQDKISLLAWAVIQVCKSDVVIGMYLWVQFLLPMAVGKSGTPLSRDLALQVLERCILEAKKAKQNLLNNANRKGERLLPPSAFLTIMEASFPIESERTKATDRFATAYPFLKELTLAGSSRSKATRPVAQQLLPLCIGTMSHGNPSLAREGAGVFLWCLSENKDCYKQWEKLHMDHIWASNCILETMITDWKKISVNLSPMDELKLTLKSLCLKHKQVLDENSLDPSTEASVKSADRNCKILLGKLGSRARACIKGSVVGAIMTIVIALIVMLALPSIESGDWRNLLPLTLRF